VKNEEEYTLDVLRTGSCFTEKKISMNYGSYKNEERML
jgi:hypothetical protein